MEFKSRQLSFKQKEVLVDFVYARPDMYKGKLTATYTNAIGIRLWKEVTCILNGIPGGATKDWKQWRKAWTDIKKNVKSRISKEKKHSQGTGGGPPLSPLEDIHKTSDEKVIEIITPVAMQGNHNVPEPEIILKDILLENFELTERFNKNNVIEGPMDIRDVNVMQDKITCEIMEDIQSPKLDHNYFSPLSISKPGTTDGKAKNEENKEPTKKSYTKSARLTDSIKNNKRFLEISQKGILSTDAYREKKLQLIRKHYETKANYWQKKIEASEIKENDREEKLKILTEISSALHNITS